MTSLPLKAPNTLPVTEASLTTQPEVKGNLRDEEWSESPKNPKRWSPARTWTLIWLFTILNLMTAMCSSEFEPALPAIMSDLNFSNDSLASFSVSIYTIGYSIGPLIAAPVSEIYGRMPVLYAGYALFMVSLAACGSSHSLALFMVFRALMGIAGIAFSLVGCSTVADLIPREKRGLALSIMSFGPVAGPTLSPIIGGYIVENTSWRWVFWTTLIGLGALLPATILIMRETYEPVLRRRYQPEHEDTSCEVQKEKDKQALIAAWTRPVQMISRCPILLLLAIFSAIANGNTSVCFATVGTVFQSNYKFSSGQSGLAYMGLTVGFIFSQCTLGRFSDRYVVKMEAKHGSKKPEARLPPAIIGACLLPIGLFWYGWSLESHTHWIVPIVGSSFIAIGVLYSYLAVQMYLVDAYTTYAASALGACTIIRSLGQSLIPLAANPLYNRLGYGWGSSVFAFLAMALIPVAAFAWIYGEKLRTSARFPPPG